MVSHGVEYRPYWTQMMTQDQAAWTSNLAQLLLHGPARERPNGLVILDDNLVEHACQGLMAEGLRIPKDLEVVAHCNFPAPPVNVLPVARLGFDMRQALAVCLDLLGRQRRSKASGKLTMIEPRFESELQDEKAVPQPMTA
jgi:DNA-binding LacI/PurR family transcriptional regulator